MIIIQCTTKYFWIIFAFMIRTIFIDHDIWKLIIPCVEISKPITFKIQQRCRIFKYSIFNCYRWKTTRQLFRALRWRKANRFIKRDTIQKTFIINVLKTCYTLSDAFLFTPKILPILSGKKKINSEYRKFCLLSQFSSYNINQNLH